VDKYKINRSTVRNFFKNKFTIGTLILISVSLLGFGGYYSLTYANTAEYLRHPTYAHYHFRTQIVVGGVTVNFSDAKYQDAYDKNLCSAELDSDPIDFHDSDSQMTHVHWRGITGEDFLKDFGWNFTNGSSKYIGTRFDQGFLRMNKILISGNLLPKIPDNSNFYIYTGEPSNIVERNWNNFLKSDLQDFFKNEPAKTTSSSFNLYKLFIGKVAAHSNEATSNNQQNETKEQTLERINNLVGNVVIFVQPEKPTIDQVTSKFNNLNPLKNSVCGG